jgi:solute carrier family 25 phosphate transporter 3
MPDQKTQTAPEKVASPGFSTPLTPDFSAKDYSIFFLAGALCCTL